MSGEQSASAAPAGSPMAHLPLKTERLLLRPYARDDATEIARLLNDAEMARFLMVIPHPFVEFDARTLIKAAWRRLTGGLSSNRISASGAASGDRRLVRIAVSRSRPSISYATADASAAPIPLCRIAWASAMIC